MADGPRRRLGVLLPQLTSADSERLAWEEVATSYSTGMFRPVLQEAHEMRCTVLGRMPCDLCGMYLRNGPNAKFPAKNGDPFHYFDGDGMIASFTFDGCGSVSFSHKWIRTERFQSDARNGRSLYDFGSLSVGKPVGHKVLNDAGERMGKANTSLLLHHRQFYALEDADLPYRVELPSLRTIGRTRFKRRRRRRDYADETDDNDDDDDDDEAEQRVFTAHPKICPATGELIGYSCEYVPFDQQWVYRLLSKDGEMTRQFSIPLRHTSYNHDCAATRNFSIVYDGNLVLSWDKVMNGGKRDNCRDGSSGIWQFLRDIPGRIGIFPRHATHHTSVQWFDVEPYCVSHTACAWEETDTDGKNTIVVIITNNIGHESFSPTFPTETPCDPDANLHEYRFHLKSGHVEERALMRIRSDFPTTHTGWNKPELGHKQRFIYAALLDYEEPNHAPILFGAYKYDLANGECKRELWGNHCYGGEPFFVPRSNPHSEDDGYVLVLVNNAPQRRTELRIFDALLFGQPNCEALVCTIVCPRRIVPMGTHGIWLDKSSVEAAAAEL